MSYKQPTTKRWWQSRIIILALFNLFFAGLDATGVIPHGLAAAVGIAQAVLSLGIIYFRKHTTTTIT